MAAARAALEEAYAPVASLARRAVAKAEAAANEKKREEEEDDEDDEEAAKARAAEALAETASGQLMLLAACAKSLARPLLLSGAALGGEGGGGAAVAEDAADGLLWPFPRSASSKTPAGLPSAVLLHELARTMQRDLRAIAEAHGGTAAEASARRDGAACAERVADGVRATLSVVLLRTLHEDEEEERVEGVKDD
jgi:hypothetical protein